MDTADGRSLPGTPGLRASAAGTSANEPTSAPAESSQLPHDRREPERFALTSLQKGLLAESMVALDRGANVEQIVWELDHVPAFDRFRAAWQGAVDAFDALRLAFAWPEPGAEPQQTVLASVRLPFRRVDCPEPTPSQQLARLERFLEEDRRAGFDLSTPPLTRVSLLVLEQSRAVCVWTIHHTIIDGNSYATVLQRVLEAYAARKGSAPEPSGRHPQFTDFLRWVERHDPTRGIRHFTDLLKGFDAPTPLPLREDNVGTAANRSSQTSLRLEPETAEKLREMARRTESTPNTLVQVAWALLLSRYSGEDDVAFGATWSGRVTTLEDAGRVVGPLINTLPVRVRLGEAATVRDLIAALRRQHLAMRPYQQTPAGKIKAGSTLAHSPHLFPTIVLFESRRFYSILRAQDERWRGHRLWSRSQANVPLVLAAYFEDGALVLELEYDLGLYAEDGARRLLSEYARILSGIGQNLDRSPFRVPMLDPSVRARLTIAEAERELVPAGPNPIERILARASVAPDAIAVKEPGGRGIGYAELARRVLCLAGVLRSRGVDQGVFVGVLLPRSIDAVVSLLAVHAAGGAFVPLDPADPEQRLEFIIRDSSSKLVIVNRETRGVLRSARDSALEVDATAIARARDVPRSLALPEPTSPAYVIYTSGSTGEPKGVCVSYGALANHVAATLDIFALGPQDRAFQFTALTFDVWLEELMPTLAAGARLVLRSDAMTSSAQRFLQAVREEGLTVLNLPTSFWHQLVRAEHLSWPSCVRLVVVGGEQVSPEAHRRFRAADTRHIRWLNAYGPTETTITSTCYDDAEGDCGADFVPIGRPLAGVSHFVLDRHMRLVPVGQPGQLYIGGAGLALGYLGREELTQQRFVEHPFRRGARLYATGDRVRVTNAGNYVYLGRLDDQIKVRGFRVELGEIEARLLQHPAVSEAAVIVRERGFEQESPVGFVVADERAVSEAELRDHLAATLPSYMIPSRLVIRPDLPSMSSGKIDRRALARLDIAEPAESAPPAAAADPLLRSLSQIWTLLLGEPVTDTSASFFDLGGDSLLVVQMFTEIEVRLGRTCDPPAFFRNPTLSNLARLLRSATQMDWSAPLVQLARGRPGARPLFLAPPLSGRGLDYVYLADALSEEIPLYALQTAAGARSCAGQETLRELARAFASRIQEVQPRGPYAVAGFSAAGVVAMAIAEELRTRGEATDFVGVIDSAPPSSVPVPSPFSSPRRLARLSRTALGRVRETLSGPHKLARLWSRTRRAVLRSAARWHILMLREDPTIREAVAEAQSQPSDAERERRHRYFEAIWTHEFVKMPIDMVLFRVALDPFEGPHEPQLGWQRVTSGTIMLEYLSGSHEDVLTPEGSRELASRLEAHLKLREAAPGDLPTRSDLATGP